MKEKLKSLERYIVTIKLTNLPNWTSEGKVDKYALHVCDCQALCVHTSRSEWIVNSNCTHNIDKDGSLFSSLKNTL